MNKQLSNFLKFLMSSNVTFELYREGNEAEITIPHLNKSDFIYEVKKHKIKESSVSDSEKGVIFKFND